MIDKDLRRYRKAVHLYLDSIWLMSSNYLTARNTLYKWLAIQMNKDIKDTHASKFTISECKQALKILKVKYEQLTGRRNVPNSLRKIFSWNSKGIYSDDLIRKIRNLKFYNKE